MLNKDKYVIRCKNVRPLQFVAGKITTMNAFTDKRGKDWNKARQSKYFKSIANNELQQKDVLMTTLHQLEEAYIMFAMAKK